MFLVKDLVWMVLLAWSCVDFYYCLKEHWEDSYLY